MDDYEEPMVAFSQGLATNPKENAMLTALVETMLKSSLKLIIMLINCANYDNGKNCPYISSYYAIIDFPIDKFVWSNLVWPVKCQNWQVNI